MSEDRNLLERIMELGIGISVARQMPDMLSRVMPGQNGPVPQGGSSQAPPPVPAGESFYLVVDNVQAGPFGEEHLEKMAKNGLLTRDTLVWKSGMTAWQKAGTVPEINKILILSNL
jgi:hypothetical protein